MTFLLIALALVILEAPAVIARVIAPLGFVHLTYWIARVVAFGHASVDAALPSMLAARAVYFARDRRASAEWVRAKLAKVPAAGGAGAAAAAMLRDALGDRDGARRLFESVGEMHRLVVPPSARSIAATWLAADAAERGDLRSVRSIAKLAPLGAASLFLDAVARRMIEGKSAVSDWYLYGTWILALRPRTKPLLDRALAHTPEIETSAMEEDAPMSSSVDAFTRAMTLHAEIIASKDASFFAASRLGSAWDAALADGSVRDAMRARATELGSNIDPVERVRDEAEDEIAKWARERELCLADVPDAGAFLSRAALRLRANLLEDIESMARALRRRAEEKRELPSIDEWTEWDVLRRKLEAALRTGGREVRRLAIATLSTDLAAYAIWMWNERKEKIVANAVFRWLAAEAIAAGDVETADLHGRNALLRVR